GSNSWRADDLVEDVCQFLDALEIQAAHILGESTGGKIGALFAARYPNRVKTLALCSTPVRKHDNLGVLKDDTSNDVHAWLDILMASKVLHVESSAKRSWIFEQHK